MARDPELQRSAGPRRPRHVGGQSRIVPQSRAVGIPWQHPNLVLHSVCELSESIPPVGAPLVGARSPAPTPASRTPSAGYRCITANDCKKDFTVKTGTVMHDSKLPLSKWALAFYLFSTNLKGVSSMKLHRDLGITQKTAWHLAHRIRQTWSAADVRFSGPVEADETFRRRQGKETSTVRSAATSAAERAARFPLRVSKTASLGK